MTRPKPYEACVCLRDDPARQRDELAAALKAVADSARPGWSTASGTGPLALQGYDVPAEAMDAARAALARTETRT